MIKLALLLLLACTALPAQVVTIINQSTTRYDGWTRVMLAQRPPHFTGWLLNQNNELQLSYAVGHRDEAGNWAVDIRAVLTPGEHRTIDLAMLQPTARAVPQLPGEIVNYFQGMPHINGVELVPTRVVIGRGNIYPQWHDGAGFTSHIGAYVTPDLIAKLFVTWYPDQPGWCHGKMTLLPVNSHYTGLNGLNMSWGSAFVIPYNGAIGQLLPPSYPLTAGNLVEIDVTIAWWDRIPSDKIESFIADARYQVLVRPM